MGGWGQTKERKRQKTAWRPLGCLHVACGAATHCSLPVPDGSDGALLVSALPSLTATLQAAAAGGMGENGGGDELATLRRRAG